MPNSKLRAVVIGTGFAGEGHTIALRYCGVDVVAICGRQEATVKAVADRLGVPLASTDWRQTLLTLKPDIVALATPAVVRGEIVEVAAALGCHMYCDKPLAIDATVAKRLYSLANEAGVKHAFAATHRYDPSIAWLAELVRDNSIGQLREVDILVRFPGYKELTPWTWFDSLASGGGILNLGMHHFLGMLESMVGSEVVKASGEAQVLRRQAPVVPELHDYRRLQESTPTPAEAEGLEWRSCDADDAFSALLTCASAVPDAPAVRVHVHVNWMAGSKAPNNGWYLYGSQGTLMGNGIRSFQVYRYDNAGTESELLPIPPRVSESVPQMGDPVQNHWTALAQDFVRDICGEAHQPYLTFRDGWRYQEVIDAIREDRSWSA